MNNLGREKPVAIARIRRAVDPDIVALQEVEFLPPLNSFPPCSQACWIATRFNMHYCFFPLRRARWGGFGLALVSRKPLARIKSTRLTYHGDAPIREARGAMWCRLDHIVVARHFKIVAVKVPLTLSARVASDPRPVCVKLERHFEG